MHYCFQSVNASIGRYGRMTWPFSQSLLQTSYTTQKIKRWRRSRTSLAVGSLRRTHTTDTDKGNRSNSCVVVLSCHFAGTLIDNVITHDGWSSMAILTLLIVCRRRSQRTFGSLARITQEINFFLWSHKVWMHFQRTNQAEKEPKVFENRIVTWENHFKLHLGSLQLIAIDWVIMAKMANRPKRARAQHGLQLNIKELLAW